MLEHDEGWWNEPTGLEMQIHLQDADGHFSQSQLVDRRARVALTSCLLSSLAGQTRSQSSWHPQRSFSQWSSTLRAISDPIYSAYPQSSRDSRPHLSGCGRMSTADSKCESVTGPVHSIVTSSPVPLTAPSRSLHSVDAPLDASKVCQLANPHSNAFVDLDGDCLAGAFTMILHPRSESDAHTSPVTRYLPPLQGCLQRRLYLPDLAEPEGEGLRARQGGPSPERSRPGHLRRHGSVTSEHYTLLNDLELTRV